MAIKNKIKCGKCEYEWSSRTKEPKACPRCKRYDYKHENKLGSHMRIHRKEGTRVLTVQEA